MVLKHPRHWKMSNTNFPSVTSLHALCEHVLEDDPAAVLELPEGKVDVRVMDRFKSSKCENIYKNKLIQRKPEAVMFCTPCTLQTGSIEIPYPISSFAMSTRTKLLMEELNARTIDEAWIYQALIGLIGEEMLVGFGNSNMFKNPGVVTGRRISSPITHSLPSLNTSDPNGGIEWLSGVRRDNVSILLTFGMIVTAFHQDEWGSQTSVDLLDGCLKVFVYIFPESKGRFKTLLKRMAAKYFPGDPAWTCPAYFRNSGFVFTLKYLRRKKINFGVEIIRPNSLLLMKAGLWHMVLTLPKLTQPVSILENVDWLSSDAAKVSNDMTTFNTEFACKHHGKKNCVNESRKTKEEIKKYAAVAERFDELYFGGLNGTGYSFMEEQFCSLVPTQVYALYECTEKLALPYQKPPASTKKITTRIFHCGMCTAILRNEEALAVHLNRHVTRLRLEVVGHQHVTCLFCGCTFHKWNNLLRHVLPAPFDSLEEDKCSGFIEQYAPPCVLKHHRIEVHGETPLLRPCRVLLTPLKRL